ncbi:MAG: hypothetical protein ACYC1Q_04730 [Bacteroidia bacterium]
MNIRSNQTLKAICLVSALFAAIIWVSFFIAFFGEEHKLDYFLQNPNMATYPLFCFFSIIILVKANSNTGVLLFSLFLSLISQNIAITHHLSEHPYFEWMSTISFILTSFIFIKSFQNFPQPISPAHIDAEFPKSRILKGYLKAFLSKYMGLYFALAICTLSIVFTGNPIMKACALFTAFTTGLLFLYLNYKISSPSNRNKIVWLFWGFLSYLLLTVLYVVLTYTSPEILLEVSILFKILRALPIFIAVTMCLFFFDTFDTGVLIRRTLVDGSVFIVIVFLYNTLEHYFLHWLSHEFHISNVLISSVLSGFFVLIFSPIHHKFMHVLDGKFRRKEKENSLH